MVCRVFRSYALFWTKKIKKGNFHSRHLAITQEKVRLDVFILELNKQCISAWLVLPFLCSTWLLHGNHREGNRKLCHFRRTIPVVQWAIPCKILTPLWKKVVDAEIPVALNENPAGKNRHFSGNFQMKYVAGLNIKCHSFWIPLPGFCLDLENKSSENCLEQECHNVLILVGISNSST